MALRHQKMNPAKSVPADKVARIVEAIRLAPSANGLQPYQVIVVNNKTMLEKLKVAGKGQSQITDGSHLLVLRLGTTTLQRALTTF